MNGYSWQVIEDFNGHLYLCFFNKNCECIYFQSGCERNFDQLIEDLNNYEFRVSKDAQEQYEKLTSKDTSAWWIIADMDDIYYSEMGVAAYNLFSKNQYKLLWLY